MSEPFLGEIRMFGGNYAPVGWVLCDGSLLSISEYEALYNLLGTTYGGDGTQTFGVPDLRGRIPVGAGNGPGLTPRTLGQMAGTESVTLLASQMPTHTHGLYATTTIATQAVPGPNSIPATPTGTGAIFYAVPGAETPQPVLMGGNAVSATGGNQPHDNMMPTLTVSMIMCTSGIYPTPA